MSSPAGEPTLAPRSRLAAPARVAAVASALRHVRPTDAFARLAELAATLVAAPTAYLSVLDADVQRLLGSVGLPAPIGGCAIDAGGSLCQFVVAGATPVVVGDLADHALVARGARPALLDLRSYLGVPLRDADGHVLGAVCAGGPTPRAWTADDVARLERVAALATDQLLLHVEMGTRREATEALRRATHAYQRLADHLPDVIARVDRAGRYLFVNAAIAHATGRAPAEHLGRTHAELGMPPALAARWAALVAQVVATGAPARDALVHDTPHGRRLVDVRLVPERAGDAPDAPVESVLVVTRDVTDDRRAATLAREIESRRHVEAALREREARFRGVLETVRACAVTLDAAGTITFANDALCAVTGWTRDELVGADWFARCIPDGVPVRAVFDAAVARGDLAAHHENEIRCRDGSRRLIAWDNTLLRDAAGAVVGTASIGHDVTEARALEAALREREARLQAVFECAGIGMALVGVDGDIVQPNPALCAMLGYAPEALVGRSIRDVTHPDDYAADATLYAELVAGARERYHVEKRYVRRDGRTLTGRLTASIVRAEDGSARYGVGMVEDVTARVAAESALRASETRFRAMLDAVQQCILVVGVDDRITYANAHAATLTGWAPEELVGRRVTDRLIAPEGQALYARRPAERARGVARQYEVPILRADGTVRWVEIHAAPFRDAHGNPIGAVGAMTDVTERRARERTLAHRATRDPLTGLLNRAEFEEALAATLAAARDTAREAARATPADAAPTPAALPAPTAEARGGALLYLDLDGFKPVNDRLGHAAGDHVLRTIADRLAHVMRSHDVVARLGGDEFAILVDTAISDGCLRDIVGRIQAACQQPIPLADTVVTVGVSVGHARLAPHASPADVLAQADASMYGAKRGRAARARTTAPGDRREVAAIA